MLLFFIYKQLNPTLINPKYGIGVERKVPFGQKRVLMSNPDSIANNYWLFELTNHNREVIDGKKKGASLFAFIAPRELCAEEIERLQEFEKNDPEFVKGVKEGWSILFISNQEYVIIPPSFGLTSTGNNTPLFSMLSVSSIIFSSSTTLKGWFGYSSISEISSSRISPAMFWAILFFLQYLICLNRSAKTVTDFALWFCVLFVLGTPYAKGSHQTIGCEPIPLEFHHCRVLRQLRRDVSLYLNVSSPYP